MADCRAKVHVGDVGTSIEVTVVDEDDAIVDISSPVSLLIILTKPDGTTKLSKTGVLQGDGARCRRHGRDCGDGNPSQPPPQGRDEPHGGRV